MASRVSRFPLVASIILSVLIVSGAFYGRLTPNLHSENFNIAQALYAGRGYADAIGEPAGPTAWSAPVYPLIEVVLLWLGDGSRAVVQAGLIGLHVATLIATAVLVVTLARQTTRLGAGVAALLFVLGLVYHFWNWFQVAQDCWLVLLTFDLLIAGFCWLRPLDTWQRAAGWGLVGGFSALVNPSVALAWGVLTLLLGHRRRTWSRPAVALLVAVLALAPWAIRNYLVFGRLIPVKSNMAYELYQTQCLQADGLLQSATLPMHPSSKGSREQHDYIKLGESAYLDRKWQQFAEAVRADPEDFLDRIASRFLAATVWYVPFNRVNEERRPWILWTRRLTHPLPFLALLVLLYSARREPLSWPQWTVVGMYGIYLLPYIAASYYERYVVPLLVVKVLLVLWTADRIVGLAGRKNQVADD